MTEPLNEELNDADYHHGAEAVAKIFENHLKRHLVEFSISNGQVRMNIGSTRITFMTTPEWTPPELERALGSQEAVRLITRVTDVQKSQ